MSGSLKIYVALHGHPFKQNIVSVLDNMNQVGTSVSCFISQ